MANCVRGKAKNVPLKEREFLQDQRGPRKMAIGGIDVVQTRKIQKRKLRHDQDNARLQKTKTSLTSGTFTELEGYYSSGERDDQSEVSELYEVQLQSSSPEEHEGQLQSTPHCSKTQMRRELPALAIACDRYAVSDRSAAGVASAVLQDMGIVTVNDKSKVIDRSKIRRQRRKARMDIQKKTCVEGFEGIYFDGRKDKTMAQTLQSDNKFHRMTVLEEHISIIAEPGSSYFAHITVEHGTAKCISKSIIDCITEAEVNLHHLKVVGCDGTAVNTGANGGVVRLLEQHLGRPLQWIVCQLHANELPLRHLFQHLDGSTTGPKGFSGTIGKSLIGCEKLPLSSFCPIDGDFPDGLIDDLSTDQKYLHDICTAVSAGNCSKDLSLRCPGMISHSRWLTVANRIMRLYVSCDEPSVNLQTLTHFIMRVYAPMWFQIKTKPSCKDGARHLFQTMKRSRYLPDDIKRVIDPVIQRNGYFGHCENLILAMISDERTFVRELGIRRILKMRLDKVARHNSIRKFVVPKFNFEATDYTDMIDWQNIEGKGEPP